MTAPSLPAFLPESPVTTPLPTRPARSRAARIIDAWLAWRRRKATLEHALEASALATMLAAWIVGYAALCPAAPVAPAQHHRAAATLVVLR